MMRFHFTCQPLKVGAGAVGLVKHVIDAKVSGRRDCPQPVDISFVRRNALAYRISESSAKLGNGRWAKKN
jgi:hypothetical protein